MESHEVDKIGCVCETMCPYEHQFCSASRIGYYCCYTLTAIGFAKNNRMWGNLSVIVIFDVCGRTPVWQEDKAGFPYLLPTLECLDELKIGFVNDMPPSKGWTNIMAITDRLSKEIFAFGTNTITSEAYAKNFIDQYSPYRGFPRDLTTDRGSDWPSHFCKTFCELTGISQGVIRAYHPQ